MKNVMEHLNLLGMPVKDKVTGFKGVVVSVSYDLYGCIQTVVNPGVQKDGKPGESQWFDVARLELTAKNPVMPRPDFGLPTLAAEGKKGPAEKPLYKW